MNHVARLLSSRSTPMGHSGGGGGNEGTSRKTAFKVTASIQQNDRCTSRSNKESPPIEHRTSFAAQKNVHCAVNCNTSRLYPKNQLCTWINRSVLRVLRSSIPTEFSPCQVRPYMKHRGLRV